MTYSIVQPPFTLQFRNMAKSELINYATWFHGVTVMRIAELARVVKTTDPKWEPSETPESLQALGRWFQSQVETRPKRDEEIAELKATLAFPIEISDVELTNRTLSLAMDIGMYFAQVVFRNLPGTRWDQQFSNKRFVDYGQPVILGFGIVPLNPVRVIITSAYKAASKLPIELQKLYETWAQMRK